MKQRRHKGGRRRWIVVGALSLVLHLVLVAFLLPHLVPDEPEPIESEPDRPFEVSVVSEDDLDDAANEPPTLPEVPKPEPPKPKPEQEKPEEKPEEEEKPQPEIEKIDRKVVEQVTNQERPDDANYISQEDNQTDEETRARDTTTEDVIPSREQRDNERAKLAKAEVKEIEKRPKSKQSQRKFADPSEIVKEPTETTTETAEDGVEPVEKRRKLFEVSHDEYAEVVGHEHDEAAHEAMQDKRLLAGWEEDERVMRGALENFITEVKPGNHTSVNSHGRAWADYLGRIHRKIHVRWASGYLATLDTREDPGSPLNDPQLNAKLEFVIRASDGEVDRINIVRSSGELRFDAEAVMISKSVGPHPSPPRELVSPDGNVYVHWNFWRDQRQCGVFGASVYLVQKDEG